MVFAGDLRVSKHPRACKPMARFFKDASDRAPRCLRIRLWSSRYVVSRGRCNLFSMHQCPRLSASRRCSSAFSTGRLLMPQTVSLEVFAPSERFRRTMKTCAAKGKSIPQAVTGAVMMRREVIRPFAFSRVRWAEGKSAPREALFDPLAQLLLVILYGE